MRPFLEQQDEFRGYVITGVRALEGSELLALAWASGAALKATVTQLGFYKVKLVERQRS